MQKNATLIAKMGINSLDIDTLTNELLDDNEENNTNTTSSSNTNTTSSSNANTTSSSNANNSNKNKHKNKHKKFHCFVII